MPSAASSARSFVDRQAPRRRAGAWTATLVSARRRDLRGTARWLALALLTGALAVAFEEATPDDA
ncbi:hypothetical protein [Haloplanus natans]|uniref:hypothetical protein n=1 Tax=Haloplanus natans TaxID=376171 RepID=UPI00067775AC|nr:hypothetical protein [Haloplanus natans]